jgi:hypothetical protein
MSRKVDLRDLETVDRLVRTEIEEGLATFRADGAEARLRTRIAAGPGPVRRRPLASMAVPILLATSAAVIAFLLVTLPPDRRPIDARDFMTVLLRSPALARPSAEASQGPMSRDGGGGFERALAAARSSGGTERSSETGAGPAKAPSLSLSERMRILYKDKVIERALMLLINKTKEA